MKDEMARACGRWKDVKEQVDACTRGWIQGFAYRGRWFVPTAKCENAIVE
jgi:hypothetical protein